ncbi:MAG: anion permease [Christensenellaceae bacterium]
MFASSSGPYCLGIRYPTSESHALIAGITGSAIAMHNNLDGVNGAEWGKVLFGWSFWRRFALGYAVTKLIQRLRRMIERPTAFSTKGRWSPPQAGLHAGAQDGQKFMGVFLLGLASRRATFLRLVNVPVWLMILCSLVMAFGTSIGEHEDHQIGGYGYGEAGKYQGFAADISATAGLLVCSVTGMPVSTTHAKTSAIMGVGAAKRMRAVNWSVAKEMVFTWILTFPGCGLIGFLMTKLFIFIF